MLRVPMAIKCLASLLPSQCIRSRCNKTVVLPIVSAAILFATGASQAAPPNSATPQLRTYVSGTGKDNNPCSASSPCQTFQAALALTLPGGEVYVLDSANYGPVTINKSVTITSEGAVAGVL